MPDLSANEKSGNPPAASGHQALAAHLFSLELALLDRAIRHDRARVEPLLADNFQEFGASGKIWSRSQILDLLESEPARPIAAQDFTCHSLAEGVALTPYRAVSNHPQTHEPLSTLRSSLWIFIAVKWKMRFHQGTRQQGN
jgi:hypothetical protein